ncbi:MAG: nucleotide pyrophosphohydrolase [Solobacterium sp.]|jgi:NTP pyrophosphatase (non-canonical NTP hydrolase)|nr:nucleotide pyrophosphohydrolase [Solobacterium sp.]MCH4221779.1 nucleotide pyrophosphohydrolase [Solobacterium sp.]MCH4266596.1 nucleotide pyrophosphohydrolase [Solobacterium sp.]
MDYETLRQEIEQFNKDRDWDQFHSAENLAKSISIEAGELLECFQWDGRHFDQAHTKEELSDVLIYCIQMADTLQIDLLDTAHAKMQQNAAKYPVKLAKGNAKKYSDL